MSVKQERKFEELSVDGPAFRSVLEQARKRQEARIGLRIMIDEAGAELRDIVLRPGEIQRMVQDYREALRAKGDPGADEQAAELEAMLVEIRRRVEQGVLRFSRKGAAKGTAGKGAAASNAEATGQAVEAGVKTSDEDGTGVSTAGQGESHETESSPTALSGDAREAEVVARNGETTPTDNGEGRGGTPTPPAEPGTDEPEHVESGGRTDPDDGADETSRPGRGATDWPNRTGGDGVRDAD